MAAGELCLCGFHACGEKLDEFCAIGVYGSKGFVAINEFGITQKLS
jgi:hypothetical protein